MEGYRIHTVAFEGNHRSGKGEQLRRIKEQCDRLGIPAIVIRGAGSRNNSGNENDPYSEWWNRHLPLLRRRESSKEDWIEGTRRLAREMIVYRDRVLPNILKGLGKTEAVLLVDRSVLSHLVMLDDEELNAIDHERILGKKNKAERLLPTTADMFPDIIFYLRADSETLLDRLDPNDPKFEFRRRNIIARSGSYDDVLLRLPKEYRDKVVTVDATRSPEDLSREIFEMIRGTLHEKDTSNHL